MHTNCPTKRNNRNSHTMPLIQWVGKTIKFNNRKLIHLAGKQIDSPHFESPNDTQKRFTPRWRSFTSPLQARVHPTPSKLPSQQHSETLI